MPYQQRLGELEAQLAHQEHPGFLSRCGVGRARVHVCVGAASGS